ncbi:MAG: rod shape-determining protein MreC [Firmicutes bacterium]|nr:rod shape-determining protein MreC [Bacillota bacterium]MDY5335399.1 rod shape-determining protein MreC [Bacilli bacterium]OLA34338.1 MAG: rod shape-determining protein MreC [Firmicutes bacterium CAG:321_26_22]
MFGKKKNNIPKKYILVIIIILIIILLVIFSVTLKEDRKLNKVESLFKDGFTYIENIITYPFNYVSDNIKSYKKLKDVEKSNDVLETSIDRIDSIEAENIELRRQLDALKEELNINYTLSDYEYLNATVISRNVGYWYNKLTINKGSYNGVEKDMVVISSKGLIGRVVKTSTFTSDVRLITTSDTNNKISVHVSNGDNNLYGVINGYDYKKSVLELEGISNTKDVNVGDYVYTSGLGGIFPAGILIGTVTEITTDSYDLAKIMKVTPSVDFNDINYVSILKRKSDSNDS